MFDVWIKTNMSASGSHVLLSACSSLKMLFEKEGTWHTRHVHINQWFSKIHELWSWKCEYFCIDWISATYIHINLMISHFVCYNNNNNVWPVSVNPEVYLLWSPDCNIVTWPQSCTYPHYFYSAVLGIYVCFFGC